MSSQEAPRPVNVAYLVVGLVFLGIAGIWALVSGGAVDSDQLGWLLPATLVGAGVIGMVAVTARSMNRRRSRSTSVDDDRDVADLEHTAYAPYLGDEERTSVIDTQEENR